jgi:hypothetical protein
MPVSSLVVTLDSDPELIRRALDTLSRLPGVTLGSLFETRLPLVLETSHLTEGYEFVEGVLRGIDGVQFVDVVRIDFDDLEEGSWNDDASS